MGARRGQRRARGCDDAQCRGESRLGRGQSGPQSAPQHGGRKGRGGGATALAAAADGASHRLAAAAAGSRYDSGTAARHGIRCAACRDRRWRSLHRRPERGVAQRVVARARSRRRGRQRRGRQRQRQWAVHRSLRQRLPSCGPQQGRQREAGGKVGLGKEGSRAGHTRRAPSVRRRWLQRRRSPGSARRRGIVQRAEGPAGPPRKDGCLGIGRRRDFAAGHHRHRLLRPGLRLRPTGRHGLRAQAPFQLKPPPPQARRFVALRRDPRHPSAGGSCLQCRARSRSRLCRECLHVVLFRCTRFERRLPPAALPPHVAQGRRS